MLINGYFLQALLNLQPWLFYLLDNFRYQFNDAIFAGITLAALLSLLMIDYGYG